MYQKINKLDPLDSAPEFTKYIVGLGNTFEHAALAHFRRVASEIGIGKVGYIPGMSPHPIYNWFTGTPDYILEAPDGTKCVVEVKTHWYPSVDEARPMEFMFMKHWLQVQSYLEILNLDVGYLWSWTMSNGYALFRIDRAKIFWNDVVWPQVFLFRHVFERQQSFLMFRNEILNKLTFRSHEKQRMEQVVFDEMNRTTQIIEMKNEQVF